MKATSDLQTAIDGFLPSKPKSPQVLVIADTENGGDFRSLFGTFICEADIEGAKGPRKPVIPFFVTSNPAARLSTGLRIPSEFVLDGFDLHRLAARIRQLQTMHPEGIGIDFLRAMGTGAFRKRLFLDDDNHSAGEMEPLALDRMEPEEFKKAWIDKDNIFWAERLSERLEELKASGKPDDEGLRTLFPQELQRISDVLDKIEDAGKQKNPGIPHRLGSELDAAYPHHTGEELALRLAFEKAHALVIDDHADGDKGAVKTLGETPIAHSSPDKLGDRAPKLESLYDFVPLPITSEQLRDAKSCPCGTPGIVRMNLDRKDALLRFDLILLDLSLGEKHGEDPVGYQLLPILRKFFPLIPIVAYTKYRDMGHIERAFLRGAAWFLSKDESHKLPAHHIELIETPRWRREWNGVKDALLWDFPAGAAFEDYERHLIWKTIEHLPGSRIFVRPLRGGIGGARTLHCSREINGDYDRAAPVVIKIDDKFPMLLERERYQRFIHPYLSNLAGRIDVPLHVGGSNKGAIAYTYAGTSQGRRGFHREVLPLEGLLQMNLPGAGQEILDAQCYEKLFDCLLGEVLGRIHSVNPEGEPSEVDFPNLVFWESPARPGKAQNGKPESRKGSALNAYLMRMPAEHQCELGTPLKTCAEGNQTPIYVLDIERGADGYIQGLFQDEAGMLRRVDIRGLLGSFYAEHRYLRPMQPLWCKEWPPKEANGDGGQGPNESHFAKQWKKLWEGKTKKTPTLTRQLDQAFEQTKNPCTFNFPAATLFDEGERDVAKAIEQLFKWLTTEKKPREALEAGRIGIVHGDMNLGNVMVERERGEIPKPVNSAPWLIDFARTRRDWIVQDFTQLELDLCMKLVSFEFFRDLKEASNDPKKSQLWKSADEFVTHFLETPWQDPPCAKDEPRLRFVYRLMHQVRNGADKAGIRDEEYLASRVWQCLISHKILCKKWKGLPEDAALQFRCVWSLKQAFQTAKILGWKGD